MMRRSREMTNERLSTSGWAERRNLRVRRAGAARAVVPVNSLTGLRFRRFEFPLRRRLYSWLLVMGCAAASRAAPDAAESLRVIPLPREDSLSSERLRLSGVVKLRAPDGARTDTVVSHVRNWLLSHGIEVVGWDDSRGTDTRARLEFIADPAAVRDPEGYALHVGEQGIEVRFSEPAGAFYAFQTLRQMAQRERDAAGAPGGLSLPMGVVRDAPRFRWRGMHLDESRHFFGKEFVFRYLDYLAEYKLNTFHWHLTDGPGWRLDIPAYPRLTSVGAWREDQRSRPWNWPATVIHPEGRQPGDYGGFYTREDVRAIVRYAEDRFITVVPEIEMPGHAYAALVAYPEFACEGTDVLREGLRGKDAFCVGHPGLEKFLTDILDSAMELFPSAWIHIGGDEVAPEAWSRCPRCRATLEREGLKSASELQGHLIRRIERHLASKGRRLVGWDEITGDGLSTNATVMVWRDTARAAAALNQGHSVVLAPTRHCYFDYYQGPPEHEPPAIGGRVTLRDVYAFDPAPEEAPFSAARGRVLGGQGNVWTEYLQRPDAVEYMIFPRMPALAEALWSVPDRRDWDDFMARLRAQRAGWDARGIRYRAASFEE